MSRFTGIPSPPVSDVDVWEARFLNAIKQNIELLVASRNEPNRSSKAILLNDILRTNLQFPEPIQLTNLATVSTYNPGPYPVVSTTGGAGSCSNGIQWSTTAEQLPTTANTLAYSQDVTALLGEVDAIRSALNTVLNELRGN